MCPLCSVAAMVFAKGLLWCFCYCAPDGPWEFRPCETVLCEPRAEHTRKRVATLRRQLPAIIRPSTASHEAKPSQPTNQAELQWAADRTLPLANFEGLLASVHGECLHSPRLWWSSSCGITCRQAQEPRFFNGASKDQCQVCKPAA